MDDSVIVAVYDIAPNAYIALGRVRAEGVDAWLADEHFVCLDWLYSIALGGIKLCVARKDALQARGILDTDYSGYLE